jgi:hypothetical protein
VSEAVIKELMIAVQVDSRRFMVVRLSADPF